MSATKRGIKNVYNREFRNPFYVPKLNGLRCQLYIVRIITKMERWLKWRGGRMEESSMAEHEDGAMKTTVGVAHYFG